jgi:hypothetical protein
MKEFRRIEPRIAHHDDVTLTRPEGGHPVFARSINLSASGIYVHASEPCEIGSVLFCTVLLPGGPRKLLSRVMRLETLPDAIGVAMAFIDPRPHDVTALRAFVAQRELRSVDAKVHLAGMAAAVRCQAVLAGDTIRLSATLPFLKIDSEVGVMLEPGGTGEPRNGILRKITLEPPSPDGIPRLAFDVDLTEPLPEEEPTSDGKPASGSPAVLRLVRRRASPLPLPSVMISQAVEDARRARAEQPTAERPYRDTALVSRLHRFAGWTSPPEVATRQTLSSVPRTRRLPDALLIAVAALTGFLIAFMVR